MLILSAQGIRTPEEARQTGLPVVLVINGIHPGEVEGKESSLMLARDLLAGPEGTLLEQIVLLIVPLFNPDGTRPDRPGQPPARPGAFRGSAWPGERRRHAGERRRNQHQPRLYARRSRWRCGCSRRYVPALAAAPDDRLPRH